MIKTNYKIMKKVAEGYQKDVEKLEDEQAVGFLKKAEKQKCNKEFIALIDENLKVISKRPKHSEQKSEDEVCLLALRDLAERNLK